MSKFSLEIDPPSRPIDMEALLIWHKYLPATAHPLALERTYLRNVFASAFDAPLVILEADRGFGKTTTLSSMVRREMVSSVWLTVDEGDGDLNNFVHDLLQALYGRQIPAETSPLHPRRALDLLLGAINELSISMIVLDNFETIVRADAINELLSQLIDQLPPYTRLILATKKPSNLHRGSRVRNRSGLLTELDLRFDVEDVMQYFVQVHNYRLNSEDAAFIIDRTQGRPLLVNLLGQLARNLPSYLRIDWRRLPIGPQPEKIKLLLREVITKLPRQLARATPQLCGISALPSEDSSPVCDLLDTLAERHCLVQQYSDDDTGTAIFVPHEILTELAGSI